MIGATINRMNAFAVLLHQLRFILEQLGITQNAIQRRAQLVRDVGKKAGLGPVRRLNQTLGIMQPVKHHQHGAPDKQQQRQHHRRFPEQTRFEIGTDQLVKIIPNREFSQPQQHPGTTDQRFRMHITALATQFTLTHIQAVRRNAQLLFVHNQRHASNHLLAGAQIRDDQHFLNGVVQRLASIVWLGMCQNFHQHCCL